MAVVDSSIYLQQQAPDIVGGIQSGLKAKDMIRQSRANDREDQFNEQLKSAYSTDPATGMRTLDKNKVGALAQIDPVKAQALQMEARKQHLAFAEEAAPIILSMNDPASHAEGLKRLIASGNPIVKELPPQYDKAAMGMFQSQATPLAQHFEMKKANDAKDADMVAKGYQRDPTAPTGWTQVKGGAAEQASGKNAAEIEHLKAEATKEKAQAAHAGDYRAVTQQGALERQDNNIHARVVQNLQKNPVLQQKLTQLTNLQSAMSNFENAKVATPEAFMELQQAVRSNLGIKSGTAVGEREATTMDSMGMHGQRMLQFLTANPQDIGKDNHLAQHMKDLVGLERQNISKQVDGHINTLTAGHASMYKRRPELMSDLADASSAYRSEFAGGGQGGGMAPHPQDNEAVEWAKANIGNDPATASKAQAILKANGVQ